jgi:hypothetical protein
MLCIHALLSLPDIKRDLINVSRDRPRSTWGLGAFTLANTPPEAFRYALPTPRRRSLQQHSKAKQDQNLKHAQSPDGGIPE